MTLTAQRATTALALLAAGFPDHSRTRLREMLKAGQVTRSGEVVIRADTALAAGDTLDVSPARGSGLIKQFAANFPILYEDEHLLVTVKPAGLLTSDGVGDEPTFLARVEWYVSRNSRGRAHAGLVHRLDRAVSGILVFAKSRAIQEWFKENWKRQGKRYFALVEGHPPEAQGTLSGWLLEREDHSVVSVPANTPGAKHAVTHYQVLERFADTTLLEVELETGRKNQIRVHLSEAGCPVVGDQRYGARISGSGRIHLHAHQFILHHPITGKHQTFETGMPPGFLVTG